MLLFRIESNANALDFILVTWNTTVCLEISMPDKSRKPNTHNGCCIQKHSRLHGREEHT